MPGTLVHYMGHEHKIEAVGVTGGERYYWLRYDGAVVMVPAFMVEGDTQ